MSPSKLVAVNATENLNPLQLEVVSFFKDGEHSYAGTMTKLDSVSDFLFKPLVLAAGENPTLSDYLCLLVRAKHQIEALQKSLEKQADDREEIQIAFGNLNNEQRSRYAPQFCVI